MLLLWNGVDKGGRQVIKRPRLASSSCFPVSLFFLLKASRNSTVVATVLTSVSVEWTEWLQQPLTCWTSLQELVPCRPLPQGNVSELVVLWNCWSRNWPIYSFKKHNLWLWHVLVEAGDLLTLGYNLEKMSETVQVYGVCETFCIIEHYNNRSFCGWRWSVLLYKTTVFLCGVCYMKIKTLIFGDVNCLFLAEKSRNRKLPFNW